MRTALVRPGLGILVLSLAVFLPVPGAAQEQASPPAEAVEADEARELMAESAKLLESLDSMVIEARALRLQIQETSGEDRSVIERQLAEKRLVFLDRMGELVVSLRAQEEAGLDPKSLRASVESRLVELTGAIQEVLDRESERLASMRVERKDLDAAQMLAYEQQIARQAEWIDQLYQGALRHTRWLEEVGLDASNARTLLAEDLHLRAERESGRVRLVADEIAALERQPPADAGQAAGRLAVLKVRRAAGADSLRSTIQMMDALELDSAQYKQLLISATGEVTSDVLRREVILGLLEQWSDAAWAWLQKRTPTALFKISAFLAILVVFWVVGWFARLLLRRAIASGTMRVSQLLQTMLQLWVGRAIVLVGALFALSQLGLEIGPLLAGLGIAGFIVGFALQDTLGNFAAGMMILGYRPFDVGDTVEIGQVFGKVSGMNLVSTTILTFDNQTLVVPNGKIWGDVIKNVTNQRSRRVDMSFRVSYEDDVDHVERVLREIIAAHELALEEPEPLIKVHKLDESWVEWIVRPWTRTEDYWTVYWDVTREVKRRFDAEGVTIPVPQRDVRMHGGEGD